MHNTVFIYQKKGDQFKLIQKIAGKSYDNYIAVDVADINQNGVKEIIVSSYSRQDRQLIRHRIPRRQIRHDRLRPPLVHAGDR